MISSYGKVYAIGHAAIADVFDGPVNVEEKVDGSQFSFGVNPSNGILECRSRNCVVAASNITGLFAEACSVVRSIEEKLNPNYTYRCEYLQKPKHNVLAYDRIPTNHLMLFDVEMPGQNYLTPSQRMKEAEHLGIEAVPIIASNIEISSVEQLVDMLDLVSILGGQNIEGVVVKNYKRFTNGGHVMKGKYVSEKFKEVNRANWRDANPTQTDIKLRIGQDLRTEARWMKAVQHLRERGELVNDPKDIGPLIKELQEDTIEECGRYIKDRLLSWALKDITRVIVRGFPEWYKEQLLKGAFEK